jgi:peptidoglycan/xylan/chitin deacetylase (PgdA/CDA1 family)
MFYLVRTPWWLRRIYSSLIWRMPAGREKILYLTFDDGPHPVATPFVLDVLRRYNARGTFFCIGKNVHEYPQLYDRVLREGHLTGNHTQNHLNGWKTDDAVYVRNVREAAERIDTHLFRPPYGRIRFRQAALLSRAPFFYKVIMWDVLSADFDRELSARQCAEHVIRYGKPGSIVVFHDSEKAFDRLREALPAVLDHFSRLGYSFESISS